jgi:hypothetical protein
VEVLAIAIAFVIAVLRGLEVVLSFGALDAPMRSTTNLVVASFALVIYLWALYGMAQRKPHAFRVAGRLHLGMFVLGLVAVVVLYAQNEALFAKLLATAPNVLAIVFAFPAAAALLHLVGFFVTRAALLRLEPPRP